MPKWLNMVLSGTKAFKSHLLFSFKDFKYDVLSFDCKANQADWIWAQEQLKRIKLVHSVFDSQIYFERDTPHLPEYKIDLVVDLRARDRNTGYSTTIYDKINITEAIICRDFFYLQHIVRFMLKGLLAHEFDEVYHIDGERVFDPHRHEKVPVNGK